MVAMGREQYLKPFDRERKFGARMWDTLCPKCQVSFKVSLAMAYLEYIDLG